MTHYELPPLPHGPRGPEPACALCGAKDQDMTRERMNVDCEDCLRTLRGLDLIKSPRLRSACGLA